MTTGLYLLSSLESDRLALSLHFDILRAEPAAAVWRAPNHRGGERCVIRGLEDMGLIRV